MSNTFFNPMVGNLQQVLTLRQAQHGLSASNLANAETPGYHARRVDFGDAMQRVFDNDGLAMKRTHAKHFGGDLSPTDLPTTTIDPGPLAEDGNSVRPDEEMSLMVANNVQFNATVEVLSRQLALLEYAASDGGR